jgi:hypothetical protein
VTRKSVFIVPAIADVDLIKALRFLTLTTGSSNRDLESLSWIHTERDILSPFPLASNLVRVNVVVWTCDFGCDRSACTWAYLEPSFHIPFAVLDIGDCSFERYRCSITNSELRLSTKGKKNTREKDERRIRLWSAETLEKAD